MVPCHRNVVTFTLVIGYVYLYGYGYQGTTGQQILLFTLLAAGTIALSGISDGRLVGLWSWFTIATVLLFCVLFIWQWQTLFWLTLAGALWLHSLSLLLGIGRQPVQVNHAS